MAIFFNGQRVIKPQARIKIDTSQLANVRAGSANRLVIIGQATGGEPHVILPFSNPAAARSVLRSGEILRASNLAWTPSPNQAGASTIYTIRVNSALQSLNTTDLLDEANQVVLHARSRDYGIWNNQIQFKVDDATAKKAIGSLSNVTGVRIEEVANTTSAALGVQLAFTAIGSFLSFGGGTQVPVSAGGTFTLPHSDGDGSITVYVDAANLPAQDEVDTIDIKTQGVKFTIQYAPTNSMEVQDNLGSAIVIRYTGNGTACTMSITDSALTTNVVGSTDGSQSLNLDITGSQFDTMLELINFINAQTGYIAEASQYLKNSRINTTWLDNVAAVDIKNINYIMTANLGSLIDWTDNNSIFLTLEIPEGSTDMDALDPSKIVGYKTLSGGSEGTNTITEWQDVLDNLLNEEVDIIVPITTDPAIQALVHAHVVAASQRKKERRAYYGHPLNSSVQEIQNLRIGFNSRRATLLSPGIKLRDDDGAIVTYDSSYLAAIAAGIAAGFQDVAQSLTYKPISVIGLEDKYSDSDIDTLLESGVAPAEFVRNAGYRIIQGRTTYTLDEKSVNVEDSVSRVADFIAVNVRQTLEDNFIGEKGVPATISSVRTTLISLLQSFERSGIITSGQDPETGDDIPAYGNINITFSNKTCDVTFQVSPVEPMNFITITAAFVPTSIVV